MVNMIAFQNGRTVERINYLINSAEERKAYQRRENRIKFSIWSVIFLEALIGAIYTYVANNDKHHVTLIEAFGVGNDLVLILLVSLGLILVKEQKS